MRDRLAVRYRRAAQVPRHAELLLAVQERGEWQEWRREWVAGPGDGDGAGAGSELAVGG